MPDAVGPVAALEARLVADLSPVRRIGSPLRSAALWLGVVAMVAALLGCVADLGAVARRVAASPDMALAVAGAVLTAVGGAVAAFELSLPDRSRLWALLPLPALGLWIGASGMGCARGWLVAGTHEATPAEARMCLTFIVALSVPLSLLMLLMLRRGYSLAPTLAGATGGLAAAAAAAALLNLFHPYDAAFDDLLVHAAAVLLVVGANRLAGGRLLARQSSGVGPTGP